MARSKRAPYEVQIKELGKTGQAKFIETHNIYAILAPVEITVRWIKDGKERQEIDTLNPGMVLYSRPRRLSKWEKELPEEERQSLGIDLKWNRVRIAQRHSDLWGATRQRGRHIIDNLTERIVVVDREVEVVIPGEAKRMEDLALKLNRFTNRFLVEKITPQLREGFAREIYPIYQELEDARDEFKPKAAQLLKQAVEGRRIETAARLAEAAAKILNRWVEILDIVENCLKQAEDWLLLCKTIEMKVGWVYQRLAKLASELSSEKRKEIAAELGGIAIYLTGEVLFDPYCQRVRDPAIQNLAKAKKYAEDKKYAEERKDKAIRNLISRALSKLGAIVLKEKPTLAEIRRRRRVLPKG